MQIQQSSMWAFSQLQIQLKGHSCWILCTFQVTTPAPSFPFWGLHGSLLKEISGRCDFIDSKPPHKRERQFMKWVYLSHNWDALLALEVFFFFFHPMLTYWWPRLSLLWSGCSVLSSYHFKLWCNRRDTSGLLAHSTHEVTSKGKHRKRAFGIFAKTSHVIEVVISG